MAMLVIEGTYRISGTRPDGDSVRFYPHDVLDWGKVEGVHKVQRNKGGGAQLRLDGIDALETHFLTRVGETRQPPRFANAAAGELLDFLGFNEVLRSERDGTVTACEPLQVPGFVLTRTADVHGRCVAFAGRGPAPGRSGTRIHVDVSMVQRTANYYQLTRGLAYPTFYRKLFPDLRTALSEAAKTARAEQVGLWPKDVTQSGAAVVRPRSLTEEQILLPKLFRRLAEYLALGDGDLSLAGFLDFLDQKDDRLFIVSTGHWTSFDTIVQVSDDNTVKLTVPPEDLIFEEK
ncbi:endonuclease YncB(thermonuclease family) [Kibdelosporangium banguiense]|uniref:Endonuclease YncB(Thermonuclease family) n=1 Tax=Kibdelosporangium banguiense TaxID=1365924 RepID=A0ABS4U2P1_9PSEU|nr:nuclease [Kibdelosporangium banguiense]MBP2330932.1 endonuclease YncB(thermonuclease family) [Kibdelosporangium banguiense]